MIVTQVALSDSSERQPWLRRRDGSGGGAGGGREAAFPINMPLYYGTVAVLAEVSANQHSDTESGFISKSGFSSILKLIIFTFPDES